ncbi:MAG TPA: class I SAM-dependent methyltransferase [Chloroflexia bacterium]|nr:class I SAM-dependent methyltransferase [Chloroflexia bacterium]
MITSTTAVGGRPQSRDLLQKLRSNDTRTPDRLRAHYEIEKRLAERLLSASKEERRFLYSRLYDELFRSVPDHPQLTKREDPVEQAKATARRATLLSPFLTRRSTFLEVGPGDCALALRIAGMVRKVYAIDVSTEITKGNELPGNFELILSDGSSIPVPPGSVDVAYSDQLMEHLHPQDATDQLRNIVRALKPGGVYICITPNRISGPHDISMYFTEQPTGFHLHEYTTTELVHMFKRSGFSKVRGLVPVGGKAIIMPAFVTMVVEAILQHLPRKQARSIARLAPLRAILNRVIATV